MKLKTKKRLAWVQIALTALMIASIAMTIARWPAWILGVIAVSVTLGLRDCLRDLSLPDEPGGS